MEHGRGEPDPTLSGDPFHGRAAVAGGEVAFKNTFVYDPASRTWSRQAEPALSAKDTQVHGRRRRVLAARLRARLLALPFSGDAE